MSVMAFGDVRRDIRVISLVGVAHGLSHFYQTVLLTVLSLEILREGFGADFVKLGAVTTVFYVVSGFGQFAAGFIVDRIGARQVLLFGLTTAGLGILGLGLADNYWQLMLAAIVAGIGNCVFHPADFAILNASVHNSRLGRSFSMHSLLGTLGWAAAPTAVLTVLMPQMGWQNAVILLGLLGPGLALLLALQSGYFVDHRLAAVPTRGGPAPSAMADNIDLLIQAPILMCFGFFMLLALTIIGLQAASIPTLGKVYGLSEAAGAWCLSAMLLAGALGVLFGGFLSDKLIQRHDRFASLGMVLAAACMLVVASGRLAPDTVWIGFALCGFFSNMVTPSRDLIVREATPPGASGKVFGFVYAGLDAGSAISPTLFSILLQVGLPSVVLYLVAGFYLLAVVAVLNIRRFGRAQCQATP